VCPAGGAGTEEVVGEAVLAGRLVGGGTGTVVEGGADAAPVLVVDGTAAVGVGAEIDDPAEDFAPAAPELDGWGAGRDRCIEDGE
jgi:hypothetical protein